MSQALEFLIVWDKNNVIPRVANGFCMYFQGGRLMYVYIADLIY